MVTGEIGVHLELGTLAKPLNQNGWMKNTWKSKNSHLGPGQVPDPQKRTHKTTKASATPPTPTPDSDDFTSALATKFSSQSWAIPDPPKIFSQSTAILPSWSPSKLGRFLNRNCSLPSLRGNMRQNKIVFIYEKFMRAIGPNLCFWRRLYLGCNAILYY